MAQNDPLWTGRSSGDEHEWLARPTLIARPHTPPPAPEPPKRRGPRVRDVLLGVLLAALVGGGVAVGTLIDGSEAEDDVTAPRTLPAAKGGAVAANRINEIYASASDSVVSVQAVRGGSASSGTGFVTGADGTIITNAHVVGAAQQVQVRFDDDGRPVAAEVVGTDPSSDLAVLKVDPGDVRGTLRPLALANSDGVRVGDQVVAIGYPLGLDRTATAGIVSGLGREIEAPNGFRIDEVIQTDAPINPGNSGGPLLDMRGRVIGVNSQIASATGGNIGIGFAVPSNTVREVVPQLQAGRRVQRPYLGVSTSPAVGTSGAVVREVTPGGPAQRAGLRPARDVTGSGGDVIVSVAGRRVNDPDDVAEAIDGRRPGDRIQVEVLRDGARQTIEVQLGQRPDSMP